ncbi:centrosomal protein of 170 kDa protein B-like [Phalacrocorax carbo]|uniref:centrosomal protein of 170 kDa protein B-like n=1 Tax=Phalacrocorax carbo TaxID=9209 RepID=UPI0031199C0D
MPHPLTLSPLPAAFVFLESSQPSRTHCPVHPEMDAVYELARQMDVVIKDLKRYLDRHSLETSEDSDSSWTTVTASEVESCSSVSLSPSRADSHNSIMASAASSSTEESLSPLSGDSRTKITASDVGCSSREPLPTLVGGEDMAHASTAQLGLGHPSTDLEEQPGPATRPPCSEEVLSCLKASSVQQQQRDLEVQLGAPVLPPEVPDVHPRETETPIAHHRGQDTLEGLIPEPKLEQELGLAANVDESLQDVPAAAPPSPRQREERDVMVVPIVQDLPFLDEAVKRQLERHIVKKKIQRRYGLPTRVLEYEKSFEDLILGQTAQQPPAPQRHTGLPYRSPFQRWDRHVRTRKTAGQPPGPQEESAGPVDTWPRGMQAPVHSGPAAFLGAAREMPLEDGETPPCKREHGGTDRSSSNITASRETLLVTHGKEKVPGTQGHVHSPSPSDQAEQAPPQGEGAPREQAGRVSESPSTSCRNMGPPELLLEKSVPMGEADRSLEGRHSSREDLRKSELPSDLTAPPRSSSPPQAQCSSSKKTPSALPLSPDSAGTSHQIPHLEELLSALARYYRASQAAEDLEKQLMDQWLEQTPGKAGHPRTDPPAELLGALQGHSHRGAERGKGSAQGRAGSRKVCPTFSKAPCQGQKRAAAGQQSQWVHVSGSPVHNALFQHRWLLPRHAPA